MAISSSFWHFLILSGSGWGGGVGFGGPESDNGATYGDGIGCEGCEYYSFLHLKTYNATLSDVFRLEYLPFTYSQC